MSSLGGLHKVWRISRQAWCSIKSKGRDVGALDLLLQAKSAPTQG